MKEQGLGNMMRKICVVFILGALLGILGGAYATSAASQTINVYIYPYHEIEITQDTAFKTIETPTKEQPPFFSELSSILAWSTSANDVRILSVQLQKDLSTEYVALKVTMVSETEQESEFINLSHHTQKLLSMGIFSSNLDVFSRYQAVVLKYILVANTTRIEQENKNFLIIFTIS